MATIDRAVALGQSPEWSQIFGRPDWIHAMLLEWAGELSASRAQFEALYRAAVDQGDEHALPFILFHFARIELLIGDWEQARKHASESRETTLQSGLAVHFSYSLVAEALVDAHLGLVEPARAKIEEGLRLADELGSRSAGFELLAILGFLELSLGNAREADRALSRLAAAVEESGLREPALFRFQGDAIEAKITLGKLDDAEAMLAQLDRLGATLERPWAPRHVLPRSCPFERCPRRPPGVLPGARASSRATRPTRGAVRARPHTRRPRQRPPARSQEARRPPSARERARDLRPARGGLVGGENASRARTRRRPRSRDDRTDTDGATDRGADCIRAVVSRDGGRALHQPQDGAVEPVEDLPQARHPLTRGAPGSTRREHGSNGPTPSPAGSAPP